MRGKASALQTKDTNARTASVAVERAIGLSDGARYAKELNYELNWLPARYQPERQPQWGSKSGLQGPRSDAELPTLH